MSLTEERSQIVIPQVPTSNSFSVLSDINNNNEDKTNIKCTTNEKPCEIRLVMDSHGNGVDPKNRNKDAEIIFLGKGEKTISGANSYCETHKPP